MYGDFIPKVYKQKNGKYIVYLPYEVVSGLSLKENDELDFFKFGENSFIVAKKEDVAALLSKNIQGMQKKEELSKDEIEVLKKLDTLRYSMRNKENVEKLLNENEKKILNGLIKKKVISIFSKGGEGELYSISKDIYDRFLMRKKEKGAKEVEEEKKENALISRELEERYGIEHESAKKLEEKGYVVLQTEAEAASLSIALEESIRQGLVLGTRAFNKKFYILLRNFFDRYAPQVIKLLSGGEMRIEDIARRVGIEEDAARGILYLLAESGDVSEKKRDLFVLT